MSATVNYKGNTITTLSNQTKTLQTAGKWLEDNIEITDVDTAVISVIDTVDTAGGTIRQINAINISDTTATAADVINQKYFYTADGTKTQGTGSGQEIYVSSTGLLYTPIMTIDLGMDRANGYYTGDVLTRYGSMPYLTELTLTGVARNNTAGALIPESGLFTSNKYPLLKKLHIEPTEVRNGSGAEYGSDDSHYNKFTAQHYAFKETNLTELTLGKVGGPYFGGGGYFRNDLSVPPGKDKWGIGSEDGLTLIAYMESYNATAGFMMQLASNTTLIIKDYITGEVLTP